MALNSTCVKMATVGVYLADRSSVPRLDGGVPA